LGIGCFIITLEERSRILLTRRNFFSGVLTVFIFFLITVRTISKFVLGVEAILAWKDPRQERTYEKGG